MSGPPFQTSVGPTTNDRIDEDYAEATPIKAYLVDSDEEEEIDEIEALNVDVLPTRAQAAQNARSKLRRYGIIGTVVIILLAVAIMVPLSLTVLKSDLQEISYSPSAMPSVQPSWSPTMALFTEYVDKASEVSNKTLITTPGTAQYKAMKWIYYDDPFGRREVEDERFLQRYIAAVFYFSTSEGNGWSDCYPGDVACTSDNKREWFGPWDECEWYAFIECNLDGFVTKFSILNNQNGEGKTVHGNNLHGTLPSEMGYLSSLTHLLIARNPLLVSSIPTSFGRLTKLRRLTLILNNLQEPWGEDWLENMTDLKEIYLNYNDFKMSLPIDISNTTGLTKLEMAGNKIYGTIPSEYGRLYNLKKLVLSDNALSGAIPLLLFPSDSNSGLPALEELNLEINDFNETLPDAIGNMTFLHTLRLSNNNLNGAIPSSLGKMGQFTNMAKNVRLEGNRFSGYIPTELSQIYPLDSLNLQDNKLFGNFSGDSCSQIDANLKVFSVDCDQVSCQCCIPACL